eukprot:scaffold33772_cov41-Attheya_sp.AAC.1
MWKDPGMGVSWTPLPTESMKQAMKQAMEKKNLSSNSNSNMTESSASRDDIHKNGSGKAAETKRQTVAVKAAAVATNKTKSGTGEHEATASQQQQQLDLKEASSTNPVRNTVPSVAAAEPLTKEHESNSSKAKHRKEKDLPSKDIILQKGDSSPSTNGVVTNNEITPDKPSATIAAEILPAATKRNSSTEKSVPHKETTLQIDNLSAKSISSTANRNKKQTKDVPCKDTTFANTRNGIKAANEIIPKISTYSLFIPPDIGRHGPAQSYTRRKEEVSHEETTAQRGNVSAPANGVVANEITPTKSKPAMVAAPPIVTHGDGGASEMEQKPPSFKAEIASVEAQCGVEPKPGMNLKVRVQQLELAVLGIEKDDYVKKRLDHVCTQLPELICCIEKLEGQLEIESRIEGIRGNNNTNLLIRTMNIEKQLGINYQYLYLKARLMECVKCNIFNRTKTLESQLGFSFLAKGSRTFFYCLERIESELGLSSLSSSSSNHSASIKTRLDDCEKTLPQLAVRIRHLECRIEIEVPRSSDLMQRVKKLEDEIGSSCDELCLKARLDECYKNCS